MEILGYNKATLVITPSQEFTYVPGHHSSGLLVKDFVKQTGKINLCGLTKADKSLSEKEIYSLLFKKKRPVCTVLIDDLIDHSHIFWSRSDFHNSDIDIDTVEQKLNIVKLSSTVSLRTCNPQCANMFRECAESRLAGRKKCSCGWKLKRK